jgi:dipeptidase E
MPLIVAVGADTRYRPGRRVGDDWHAQGMSSGVYLGGGGSAEDEAAVWDAMLDGVSRLLYWPVALSGPMLSGADGWLRDTLAERSSLEITTWTDLDEHRRDGFDPFELIFVGGGNTFDLQHRIRTAGLAERIHAFVRGGGTYYGGSAGAIIAGESIGLARGIDPDDVGAEDDTGLRLVPGMDLLPHFAPGQASAATQWSRQHPGRLVFGVPEASGLHVDGRCATVLGPDPVDVYCDGRRMGRYAAAEQIRLPG